MMISVCSPTVGLYEVLLFLNEVPNSVFEPDGAVVK